MLGGFILWYDSYISAKYQENIYNDITEVPHHKVGLVLGTSKYTRFWGTKMRNLYYIHRIDAAISLYNAEKIDFILVSGDNSTERYDEPTSMKNDLIELWIPAEKIYLDYAGFRTLDSIVRAKEIFNLEEYIVISQQFHNERALHIAQEHHINAVAFNAKDVPIERWGLKVQIREKLARVKMFWDLLFGVTPKFLGEKIEIK